MIQTAAVVNDIIGELQPLLATCLRGQNSACLLDRLGIPCQQSLYLRLLTAIDDQNTIDELQQGEPTSSGTTMS